MSRFTLTVLPDGKAILTSERDVSDAEAQAIRDGFEEWRRSDRGVAILANTRVEHATSIDIDLPVGLTA